MDQERRSQREMMQENEKQARTTYTNAQAKAAVSRRLPARKGNGYGR